MRKFNYAIEGTAANNQTWKVSGSTLLSQDGDFPFILNECLGWAFQELTNGKAEYGKPGVGCNGPYQITRYLLEVTKDG